MVELPDRVRNARAEVAARARYVQVSGDAIDACAAKLPEVCNVPGLDPLVHFLDGPPSAVIAFVLRLDTINFGSGWWPTVQKPSGLSGYLTVASGLARRFRERGPWAVDELRGIQPSEDDEALGQDRDHELMALFAAALRDLAEHVSQELDGRLERLCDRTGGSAAALAERLAGWRCFTDVSRYEDLDVPFYKRAQLNGAADPVAGAIPVEGGAVERRLRAFRGCPLPRTAPWPKGN